MISFVIPVHNEVGKLEKCILEIIKISAIFREPFEIIISEDGSVDGSYFMAKNLAKKYSIIKVLHSSKRLGKGGALKKASKIVRGVNVVYMDADLATDINYIKNLVNELEKGCDIVVGSRNLENSIVTRSVIREVLSRVYNFLVRLLFATKLHDMQCGFKAFKRTVLIGMIEDVKDPYWFWDTELLIKSIKKGYIVKEIPIKWDENRESKVRLFHDSLYMGHKLINLRFFN